MSDPLPPLVAIVDDEAHLRTTLSRALRGEGYRTAVFADGAEAWESFAVSLPDLAVLDIIMPRMDGLELCRRIRSVSQQLPVMFLTSRDEEFDRVLGLELGADDYLCKPFSLRELSARVKVLFRRSGARPMEKEREQEEA
ncbi:MAG: response regulator, partial [Spirochaetia bacterium]